MQHTAQLTSNSGVTGGVGLHPIRASRETTLIRHVVGISQVP